MKKINNKYFIKFITSIQLLSVRFIILTFTTQPLKSKKIIQY